MFAVTLTPTSWKDILFQNHVTTTLKQSLIQGTSPNVVLLTGNSGIGKTTIAKVYAASVLCENLIGGEPCGKCVNCVDIFSDSMRRNCLKIDGGTQNTKDHFRKILDNIQQGGTLFGNRRVLIIEEAHGLTKDALESLLVPVENKRNFDIFFIFTTTERIKIKNTLKSRTMDFNLSPPDALELSKYLNKVIKDHKWEVPEDFRIKMLFDVIESCDFNIRDCLNTIHKVYLSGDYSEGNISKLIPQVSKVNIYKVLNKLFKGDYVLFLKSVEEMCEDKNTDEVFYNLFYTLLAVSKKIKFDISPSNRFYDEMVSNCVLVPNEYIRFRNVIVTKLLDGLLELKNNNNIYDRGSLIYVLVKSLK